MKVPSCPMKVGPGRVTARGGSSHALWSRFWALGGYWKVRRGRCRWEDVVRVMGGLCSTAVRRGAPDVCGQVGDGNFPPCAAEVIRR
jgi:hypothetical protein